MGLGMEPDLRFGGSLPALESRVVLFADDTASATSEASPRYLAAALTVQLAVAVAGADGTIADAERSLMVSHIHGALGLTESERRRLTALLHRAANEPPKLATLKRQVSALGAEGREVVGDFLVAIARADARVTPEEIQALQSSFEMLGLDADRLFAKVHAAEVAGKAPAAASGPRIYMIPRAPSSAQQGSPRGIALDRAKVSQLQAETDRLGKVLQSVFAEPEPDEAEPPGGAAESDARPGTPALLGLDPASSSFLQTLLARPRWSRSELTALARERGLPLDGVLERLNEATLDTLETHLFEDGDPIVLNPEAIAGVSRGHPPS
jgi:uncharacterized tellurite resistance protein B-like protein